MERILVRMPNWLGDVVMATPALLALRQRVPEGEITVLGLSGIVSALEGHCAIDRTITYDRQGQDRGTRGMWRLARRLREDGFDCAYVFPNSFSSALLFRLAGIPRRIGFDTSGRGMLLTHKLRKPSRLTHRHQSACYVTLVTGQIPDHVPAPDWRVADEELREAESLLRQAGLTRGKPLLAMNPGSVNGKAKRWPVERFVSVARWAMHQAEWDVVLLGGPSDREVGENIARLAGEPIAMLAGQTGIRQFMALLSLADLCLSNDSGGMHVAAALERPQLSLFGPTDAVTTGPLGPHQVIIRKPVACSPCLERVCYEEHHACMERITVDEVIACLASMVE